MLIQTAWFLGFGPTVGWQTPLVRGRGTAAGLQQRLWVSLSPHDDISTNIAYKSLAIIAEAIQKAISIHKV
jgi:hypothetical protein